VVAISIYKREKYFNDIMIRDGKIYGQFIKPDGDATWNADDWGRAATLEARFSFLGMSEAERRTLIPCAVWKAKFPGLKYSDPIEKRLIVALPT
jgi:hypothetical protein